jgi:hypothetical protein
VTATDRSLSRHCDEILRLIDAVLPPGPGEDGGDRSGLGGCSDRADEPGERSMEAGVRTGWTISAIRGKGWVHATPALGSPDRNSEEQPNQ